MFLVGSKGAFKAHQEHVLLELRAHQTADIGSKVVIFAIFTQITANKAQPSECGQQRTLNIVHAQTDAQQQSNGSY